MSNYRGMKCEARENDPTSKNHGQWLEARFVGVCLAPSPEPIVQLKGHMPWYATWGSVRGIDQQPLDRAAIVASFRRPDSCDDEGCPHSATEHVCINNPPKNAVPEVYMSVSIPQGQALAIEFTGTNGRFEVHYDTPKFPGSIVVQEADGLPGNIKHPEDPSIIYHAGPDPEALGHLYPEDEEVDLEGDDAETRFPVNSMPPDDEL